MRTYRRDGYTLVQFERPHSDGRAYRVLTPEGEEVGTVSTYQAAMERKTRGRRYVNARWYSERWCAQEKDGRTHYHAWETPGQAAEALLRYRQWARERAAETGV